MNKLAQFISVIFHPILLPTWMFLIFIVTGICEVSHVRAELCLAIIFGTTFILPAITLLILKKFKIIESITMEKRSDRFIPLFVMVIFLYATSRFFNGINALALYNFYLICNLMLCVVVFWINLFWKVSMHGIGLGAFAATLLLLSTISSNLFLPFFILSIIISGVVSASRLYLMSHNDSQVYIGYILGFVCVNLLWLITF
mgnify:CR=1 FL=1